MARRPGAAGHRAARETAAKGILPARAAVSTEPRWLDDDEMATWIGLLGVVILLPVALDTQLQRESGLSHFEYQVLAGLSMSPDRTLRMSDLAGFSNGSLSRLSHVAARLERRGWISRTPDPEDGRYTRATLTESGRQAVTAAAPGHVAAVRHYVFDVLTGQQVTQLREIAARLRTTLAAETGCAPSGC